MNSRSNFTSRVFLILAFACAIFVSGSEMKAASTSHKGGRLIVQRAPNFGTDLAIHLSIDGKEVANIPRDHRYDGYVSAGRHVFTAGWDADRLVLRRSTLSNATLGTPTVGRSKHH